MADRTYLLVPFDKKEELKQSGGIYDKSLRFWYIPSREIPDNLKQYEVKVIDIPKDYDIEILKKEMPSMTYDKTKRVWICKELEYDNYINTHN